MYGDGTLSIPEMRNGIPDILDEARWELDFMLKMQVPEGQPRAGMVHHKVHDVTWTGLPLRPDQDPRERYLRPPSTAATLNLAATAAQCSRIWEDFDRNYSRMCLRAAERAWKAALANPAVYAPAEDSTGGGPYNDNNVTDEFYWAAAELYATTHEAEYRKFVQESPLYLQVPTTFGENTEPGMTWGSTQALGTITLATVRDNGHKREGDAARQSIVNAANTFVGLINEQGYRLPFAPPADGRYPWGSNSFVLNNMVIMALAYDFTNDAKYFNGVVDGMGYILGRNAMDKAYVSGYGERPLENPHHRFWAHQIDPSYPSAPGGAVSGGPNSSLQDPYAQGIGLPGCAPQKCYVDHIESWSTNEITINWNAPFAWLTAFMDEQAHRMVRSANN
jgi:endoglucanase